MITLLLCSFTTCLRYFSDGGDKRSTGESDSAIVEINLGLFLTPSVIVLDTAPGAIAMVVFD